jgi:hypothetical protein
VEDFFKKLDAVLADKDTEGREPSSVDERVSAESGSSFRDKDELGRYIYEKLSEGGYSDEHAAGILGSLEGENDTFNPRRKQGQTALGEGKPKGPGEGIVQWGSPNPKFDKDTSWYDSFLRKGNKPTPRYDRRVGLAEYAEDNGLPIDSIEAQVGFLMHELDTTEKSAKKRLLKTETPEEAGESFTRYFERPRTSGKADRRKTPITKEEKRRGKFGRDRFKVIKDYEDDNGLY